jgi:hypothetical protein
MVSNPHVKTPGQTLRLPHRRFTRSEFKAADQVQGRGVPPIENGAYTSVREYINSRGNAVPPQAGASDGVLKPLLNSF